MLKVIKPGIYTSIQDRGRQAYRSLGVPISGVMDHYAALQANRIIGNPDGAAVIEITMGDVEFEALEDLDLCMTGGDLSATINGSQASMWQKTSLHKGEKLTFKGPKAGIRAYIALPGGVKSESYLGSQSVYEKAGMGEKLKEGDVVEAHQLRANQSESLHQMLIPTYTKSVTVRVVPSHHESQFTKKSLDAFYQTGFKVKTADRMGCQLEGPRLERKENKDILSEVTTFGTIQVPASGNPIILLADAQTTGGYPTIGTIQFKDLWRVSQMPPGGTLYFVRIPSIEGGFYS